MGSENIFSSRDLEIAEKLGGLTTVVTNIDNKLDSHIEFQSRNFETLKKEVDQHTEKLSEHNGFIRLVIGLGIGVQLIWVAFVAWLKH